MQRRSFTSPQFEEVVTLKLPAERPLSLFDPLEYLSWYEQHYPRALELFRKSGIHPTSSSPVINPYTGKISKCEFSNIGEHCLAVAELTRRVAEALRAAGVMTEGEVRLAVSGALLHDVGKPFEIMKLAQVRQGMLGGIDGEESSNQLCNRLMAVGFSSEVASLLAESGSECGHRSIAGFFTVEGHQLSMVRGDFVRKLVHLADSMTYTGRPGATERAPTSFLPYPDRGLYSDIRGKYPFLFSHGVALNEVGVLVEVGLSQAAEQRCLPIGSYMELDALLSEWVATEICEALQLSVGEESSQLALLSHFFSELY